MKRGWIQVSLIALLVCSGSAAAQAEPQEVGNLTFYNDFENAVDDLNITYEDDYYTLTRGTAMNFRIENVAGERPRFRLSRPGHVDERRFWVWSYDGDAWEYFDHASVDDDWYYFHNDTAFTEDSVYVAPMFPYRLSDLRELIDQIRDNPYVRNLGPHGYTPQRRPIYGFQITDPDVPDEGKHHVVLISGQHAWESWARHILHGAVEMAVSDHPDAIELRRKAILHVYPMANPDGITLGHSRDGTIGSNMNRAWRPGAPTDSEPSPVPEINIMRKAIVEATGGEATYLVDFHSHAGWYDPFLWYADDSDPRVADLIEAVNRHDAALHGEAVIGTHAAGAAADRVPDTARGWAPSIGASGLTLESGPYQRLPRQRYRRAGDAFIPALNEVLETRD